MKRNRWLFLLFLLPANGLAGELPRLDAFGDPLPKGAIARMGTARLRHAGWVLSVAYSPDGKMLASGGEDKVIRLWDAATGKERNTLAGHRNWIHTLAFSPDGSRLLSISSDETVRLWDPATGKELSSTRYPGKPFSGAFSPDSKVLAIGTAQAEVFLRDAASGKGIKTWRGAQKEAFFSLAFSPDGKTLTSGSFHGGQSGPTVQLWDWKTGKVLRPIAVGTEGVLHVAFTPDGKTLAAGSTVGLNCRNVATGKKQPQLEGDKGRIDSLTFSPDGKQIAVAGPEGLRVWDRATGKSVRSTRMRDHQIRAVAFSPDGKTLATGGEDGRVRLWAPAGDCDCRSLGEAHCEQILSVAIAPDGRTVATGSEDATARLWELTTGKPIHSLKKPGEVTCGPLFSVAFSPDGKRLAAGQYRDGITLWDPVAGRPIREITGHDGRVACTAFSPDGRSVLSDGYDDRHLHLWDAATGKEIRRFDKGVNYGFAAAYFPNGRGVASLNDEGILQGWDLTTGKKRTLGKGPPSVPVVFSADGLIWAAADSPRGHLGTVCDLISGRKLFSIGPSILCLALSPRGRLLASGAGADVSIQETATGKVLCRFTGHRGTIQALAFSPDGKYLVTTGKDCTALVWDVSDLAPAPVQPATEEQLQSLWTDLGAVEANRGYRAFLDLIDQGDRAVALIKDRLPPVPFNPPARMARLVADLDSNRFAVREKAAIELEKLGLYAEPSLRRAVAAKPSLETSRRLLQLLEKLEQSSDWWRAQRAIRLLSWIDTPQARQVLGGLAAGAAEAMPTQEARDALKSPLRRSFR